MIYIMFTAHLPSLCEQNLPSLCIPKNPNPCGIKGCNPILRISQDSPGFLGYEHQKKITKKNTDPKAGQ